MAGFDKAVAGFDKSVAGFENSSGGFENLERMPFVITNLITHKSLGMALPQDYHRKQAEILRRLALFTRDMDTASVLMQKAAEHATLADGADQLIQLMHLAGEKRYWPWPLLLELANEQMPK